MLLIFETLLELKYRTVYFQQSLKNALGPFPNIYDPGDNSHLQRVSIDGRIQTVPTFTADRPFRPGTVATTPFYI